jgi:hypothetical protein
MDPEKSSRLPIEVPPMDMEAPADFQTVTFGLG